MPSRRHSSAMLSSPRKPVSTMRIFSSAENCRRVARRIPFTTCSAGSFTGPDFCPICAPSMATMGQKSSLPQLTRSVSVVLMPDTAGSAYSRRAAAAPAGARCSCDPFDAFVNQLKGFDQYFVAVAVERAHGVLRRPSGVDYKARLIGATLVHDDYDKVAPCICRVTDLHLSTPVH